MNGFSFIPRWNFLWMQHIWSGSLCFSLIRSPLERSIVLGSHPGPPSSEYGAIPPVWGSPLPTSVPMYYQLARDQSKPFQKEVATDHLASSLPTCRNLEHPLVSMVTTASCRDRQWRLGPPVFSNTSFSASSSFRLCVYVRDREGKRIGECVLLGGLTPEASAVLNRQCRGMPSCLWGPVAMGV